MVKIAIAGGGGSLGQEVIDVLVATKKHDIIILSRRDAPAEKSDSAVTWTKTNYSVDELTSILQGVNVVISFFSPSNDQAEAERAQKALIDASIKAGVKRFAPSEWVTKGGYENMAGYAYKAKTRRYLEDINKDGKVLEYCLFQPGLFSNYLTFPHQTYKHITPIEMVFDFQNRRALIRDGGEDDHIVLTTAQDVANVVARAVEFEGEWPVEGGMRGSRLSVRELVVLGEKIRGGPFDVEKLKMEDLRSGNCTSSWLPVAGHPSIAPEDKEAAAKMITAGMLLMIGTQSFDCGDEWNRLLPDYKFTSAEEFLARVWKEGKW
ncbi:uncharacterized protein B0H64DRAFT_409694 [Chaetomium fimeti]|uniref:NmrA-like domain-containing protein n=1 Tax=Chaetomium fimeti TaxID=1854472 RepID=A0AAE0H8H7_9PEZI|nr:hypothetical protein B0H64DRAFT_409694 [Chaetomium fimeti]